MFIGSFKHNIDENGRFVIPASFREELGDTFYVVMAEKGVVALFSVEDFKKRAVALNGPLPEQKKALYQFMNTSATMTQDKLGRTTLPVQFREYANVAGNITISGMIDQIYITGGIGETNAEISPAEIYRSAEKASADEELRKAEAAL